MEQQVIEIPVLQVAEVPRHGLPTEVWLRLWSEAEQAVVTPTPSEPAPHQAVQPRPARVRYAYD